MAEVLEDTVDCHCIQHLNALPWARSWLDLLFGGIRTLVLDWHSYQKTPKETVTSELKKSDQWLPSWRFADVSKCTRSKETCGNRSLCWAESLKVIWRRMLRPSVPFLKRSSSGALGPLGSYTRAPLKARVHFVVQSTRGSKVFTPLSFRWVGLQIL